MEKATYRIELPAGQGCRYRELNTQGKGIEVKESTGANGQQVIEATASKLSPIIKEPFGPDFTELFHVSILRLPPSSTTSRKAI